MTHSTTVETEQVLNPAIFKNGVVAMDYATIGLAFRRFCEWAEIPIADVIPTLASRALIEQLNAYGNSDYVLHNTVADIQPESGRSILNGLASEHGFREPFQKKFEDDQVGLLSIIDKKMQWYDGDACQATIYVDTAKSNYQAVEFKVEPISEKHFQIYRVNSFEKPVVRVSADPQQSNGVQNYMWVTELPFHAKLDFDSIFYNVATIIRNWGKNYICKESAATVASVKIPNLNIEYDRQLSELIGVEVGRGRGSWEITSADQALRVKVDEYGAEAAAMTSMVFLARSAAMPIRQEIELGNTGNLLVWFTEGTSQIPICVVIASPEAYKRVDMAALRKNRVPSSGATQ